MSATNLVQPTPLQHVRQVDGLIGIHLVAQFGNRNLMFCHLGTGVTVLSRPLNVRAHQFRQLEFETGKATPSRVPLRAV